MGATSQDERMCSTRPEWTRANAASLGGGDDGARARSFLTAIGLLAVSVVLSGGLAAASTAKGSELLLDQITGRYRFIGGEQQRRGVKRAIERVVSRMNFLVRGFARRRLEAGNRIARYISIHRHGDRMTIAFDGRSYTAPLDGHAVWVRGASGDKLKLRLRPGRRRLLQEFRGERGQLANAFQPKAERRLVVQVTISSEYLPADVRYELTYVAIGKS